MKCLNDYHIDTPDFIKATINVDGLPIAKSSNKQFWPVLMKWKGFNVSPMVVGIFHGKKKPATLEYLKPFVDDVSIATKNGLTINHIKKDFQVEKFSLDALAMAHLKAIKGHTGYFGCGTCKIKGQPSNHSNKVICFPGLEVDLRTDHEFRAYHSGALSGKQYEKHHIKNIITPLIDVPNFDLIKGFPRDPLHLCYLGVNKKKIGFWTNKSALNKAGKLPSSTIDIINDDILKIEKMFPSDFNRKCRQVSDYHF